MRHGVATGLFLSTLAACSAGTDGNAQRYRGGSGNASNPSGGVIPTAPSVTPGRGSGPNVIGGAAGAGVVTNNNLDENECAGANVAATRVTPAVYFVIDGSSSMNARFGEGTRWSVLRNALVGPDGVVTQLESVVEFGMSIYSNNNPMMCPGTTDVAPALSNLSALAGAYPMMETGGGTPTGEALQLVVDGLPDFNGLDSTLTPPIIILATDGEPNGCSSPATCNWIDWAMCLGQLGNQLAAAPATYDTTLAAVRAARDKNIDVWVVSLADGLNNIPQLQTTANIGAGLADDASPGATIYSPQNPGELTQTLANLLGAVVSCEVSLAGKLDVTRACEGTVAMNGQVLGCDDPQGWRAVDETHIELQGMACDRFKSDPSVLLDASFPCDAVVPQ
ncbi:MAG: vWA domain-containing protein [Polyangiales bacterium]